MTSQEKVNTFFPLGPRARAFQAYSIVQKIGARCAQRTQGKTVSSSGTGLVCCCIDKSAQVSQYVHQVFTMSGFHQVFTKCVHHVFTRFSHFFLILLYVQKNLVNSPGFHQVFTKFFIFTKFHKTWWIHQVFTRFLWIHHDVHHKKKKSNGEIHQVLVKTWWIHQVFTRFSPWWFCLAFSPPKRIMFTKKKAQNASFGEFQSSKTLLAFWFDDFFHKPGEFTRFSPGFHKTWWIHQVFTRLSPSLFFTKFQKTWWIHQVFHQVFTKFLFFTKFHKTWWIHQVFTNFFFFFNLYVKKKTCEFTKFSPGFHQFFFFTKFHKTWWIHQVFTRFSQCVHHVFTRFSPGFHQVFTRFSPSFHQVFTMFLPRFPSFTRFVFCALTYWICPGFHKVCSLHRVFFEVYQVFARFPDFTRCSPSFTNAQFVSPSFEKLTSSGLLSVVRCEFKV